MIDASTQVQEVVWYETFDRLGIPPPPRLTCLLITLSDAARENLAYALGRGVMDMPRGRLLELAEASGVTPAPAPSMAPPPFNRPPQISVAGAPPLRLGGPPVDNIAIDEEGTVTLMRLVGYSIAVGIVLSLVCFRSIKITIMVFVVGGSAALLSMAMVYWTGGRVDAILMSMPSLVYVLGLSGAIHVVNYYRDEVAHHGPIGAPARALRHALLPCTLAALTTSNLVPISNFGFYSALGVIATLAVLFSYLPAALQTFMSPKTKPTDLPANDLPATDTASFDEPPRVTAADPDRGEYSGLAQWWAAVGTFITRKHAVVSTVCLLVLGTAAIGLTNIQTSVQLLKLFDSDSRIIEDYAWLEENLGNLVPMEVVLRMPEEMTTIEQLEATSRIRRLITQTLGEPGLGVVGSSTSLDNFLPEVPEGGSRYSVFRAQFERQLEQASADVYGSDYVTEEADGPYAGRALWRISLRVAALSDVDYGLFLRTLESAVDPALRAYEIEAQITAGSASSDADRDDDAGKASATRVLVLGSGPPTSIEETELISSDGTIRRDRAMMSVLGELLKAASLEKLTWRDIDAELANKLRGDERFEKLLAGYDVVLWNDQGLFNESDLSSARRLIDLGEWANRQPEPLLLTGGVPDVHRSGPMTAIYTGVVPVIYKAQRTLLTSLTESIAMAFVLIGIVMVVLLNPGRTASTLLKPTNITSGLLAGAVSMIPNVFPVLLVFGVLCHLGVRIDIGTMMVASVAMGVAVDDTIHFLTWFRNHLDEGMSRTDAVIETYRRVGPAMTQTTIVGGLGLFVFALSTFTPTQRFGVMMLVMLSAALLGDLILLPALLAGPLGKVFKPRAVDVSVTTDAAALKPVANASEETTVSESSESIDRLDAESHPTLRIHDPDREASFRKAR